MKPLTEQLKEAIAEKVIAINDEPGELPRVAGIGSAASSCAEIVKEYAKRFTEWVEEEAYFTDIGEDEEERPIWGWLLYKESNISINRPTYTIEDLFALFLKETESNQQEVNIKEPEVKQESEDEIWKAAMDDLCINGAQSVKQHFKIERRK